MRSSSSEAVCEMRSSSTKNSWNSSMISSERGHRLRAAGALVAGDVLHAELAEQVAAALQFLVHALQHAQAELAVALDGHDPRVRQAVRGVALELDALLEVDQVELDLLRAAPQRQVGDDDVEQGGLAGAGLAGDQRVLARALADGEVLELGRAGAADRRRAARSVVSLAPDLAPARRDVREGHLDAVRRRRWPGRSCGRSSIGELRRRAARRAAAGAAGERLVAEHETALPLRCTQTLLLPQFVGDEIRRQRLRAGPSG